MSASVERPEFPVEPLPCLPTLLLAFAGLLWIPLCFFWFGLFIWSASALCLLNFVFTLFGWPVLWRVTTKIEKLRRIGFLLWSGIPAVQTIGSIILLPHL